MRALVWEYYNSNYFFEWLIGPDGISFVLSYHYGHIFGTKFNNKFSTGLSEKPI